VLRAWSVHAQCRSLKFVPRPCSALGTSPCRRIRPSLTWSTRIQAPGRTPVTLRHYICMACRVRGGHSGGSRKPRAKGFALGGFVSSPSARPSGCMPGRGRQAAMVGNSIRRAGAGTNEPVRLSLQFSWALHGSGQRVARGWRVPGGQAARAGGCTHARRRKAADKAGPGLATRGRGRGRGR
jgi:hypothetical protein